MERKGWYLVGYDIAHPRRLAKIHYLLKKEGLATQRSLFFVHATETGINSILDKIALIMVLREDDLRAYPVTKPEAVWTNGSNPLADFPVICFDKKQKKTKFKKRKGFLRRILRI